MQPITLGGISLAVLLGSFALSFGLTYLPCYSAICVESFFPYSTRIHLISFYSSVSAYFLIFIVRAKSRLLKDALGTLVSSRPIPFTHTRVSWGGLLVAIGAVGFVAASQGYFWEAELEFYRGRAMREAGTTLGTTRLALVGSTAHMTDLLLGLIVIPIGRDGVLNRVFGFQVSTLLRFHQLIGYLFFVTVLIHMVPFYTWVPVFATAKGPLKTVFGIDNPTVSQDFIEESPLHYYYATVLATGMTSLLIFIIIIITSLPAMRRKSYNTFYVSHMLTIFFFILLCLHASTDFYMLLPGLVLWMFDWIVRLRGLGSRVDGKLQREENGWFRLSVPVANLPQRMLDRLRATADLPLKHFYINVPEISRYQNHPFTTASAVAEMSGDSQDISWLFRVTNSGKKEKKQAKEWTVKLAGLLESSSTADPELNAVTNDATTSAPARLLPLRLEGPYTTPLNPFKTHTHVLCIVGGTGITGALSLAQRMLDLQAMGLHMRTEYLKIIWSIRASEDAELIDVQNLLTRIPSCSTLTIELHKHLTGEGRPRLDFETEISSFAAALSTGPTDSQKKSSEGSECLESTKSNGWIYFSGPTPFMQSGETACVDVRKLQALGDRLEWYCARWEV